MFIATTRTLLWLHWYPASVILSSRRPVLCEDSFAVRCMVNKAWYEVSTVVVPAVCSQRRVPYHSFNEQRKKFKWQTLHWQSSREQFGLSIRLLTWTIVLKMAKCSRRLVNLLFGLCGKPSWIALLAVTMITILLLTRMECWWEWKVFASRRKDLHVRMPRNSSKRTRAEGGDGKRMVYIKIVKTNSTTQVNNELATSLLVVLLLRLEYVILEEESQCVAEERGGTRIFHSRIGPEMESRIWL